MMQKEWLTTKEAAEVLNTSVRNVLKRIHERKLYAKRDGKIWLVHRSFSPPPEEPSGIEAESIQNLKESLEYMKEQIDRKDKLIDGLRAELEDSRQRSDTIILQLTRQLEQSQNLLEYHQAPWWRRWRKRKEPDQ